MKEWGTLRAGVTFTRSPSPAWQSIGMAVVSAVHYYEITWLQLSNLAGYNAFRLLKIMEPGETSMVSQHRKVLARQVILEKLYYHNQQFLEHGEIPPPTRINCLGSISNNPFDHPAAFLFLLLQDSANSGITSIRKQDNLSVPGRVCQHRRLY